MMKMKEMHDRIDDKLDHTDEYADTRNKIKNGEILYEMNKKYNQDYKFTSRKTLSSLLNNN